MTARRRLIVVPIIRRGDGRLLLCRKPNDRGVFPGQWGLPGGGVEDGETIEDALRREVREELQLELDSIHPAYFKGEEREKLYPGGRRETMYMVFLISVCTVGDGDPVLNDEFDAFAWVAVDELASYDINETTRATLRQAGVTTR
ncbi:MAG TPA: nucleoside triphosphatase NudI [Gemmatimonadaceae bacterium]|nr:nucleoside triphosphatase NudI [Gemmatimonadaceae bacterium]